MKGSALRNAALMAVGMFGRFGSTGKAEKFVSEIEVAGRHRFDPGAKNKTRHKRQKTKVYLGNEPLTSAQLAYGRALYRTRRALWYPNNTDSQIPGSRRNGRGRHLAAA